MLTELDVQGLGVIEGSAVSLSAGSTALTGETGAGKTLVVAALGLLSGGRAERSMVRQGANHALVEGRFSVPKDSPVLDRLRGQGIAVESDGDEAEVILSRSVSPDGRANRSRINGSMIPLSELASVGSALIEIAGQNEHGRIAAPHVQRGTLDSFAATSALAAECAELVRSARVLETEAQRWREGERSRARELDILAFEIAEIEDAAPTVGEVGRLGLEARRLENAESISRALGAAGLNLREEGGAEDKLGAAEDALRSAADHDETVRALADRLETARLEVVDIAQEVAAASIPSEGGAIGEVQARLAVLARLRRKFGDTEENILLHLKASKARAEELRIAETGASDLEQERDKAWSLARECAAKLSAARREAAPRLATAIEDRLGTLALPDARFEVRLSPSDLGEHGAEEVGFAVSTNPGEPVKPLAKVASGGELSRISLAIHLLTRTGTADTLVFDEVDAGVGGEAAQSIGRALAELARESGSQVLVVTHLPQVAAFADNHLLVSKSTVKEETRAEVVVIEGDERILELSRMLAGLPGSQLGQEHARELLEVASFGADAL
ncbi:MAG: DNA repair protein RecN [Actinobacteria bacterium]|nr:DNA repair protein RecN [Actinomycetota bacterium]